MPSRPHTKGTVLPHPRAKYWRSPRPTGTFIASMVTSGALHAYPAMTAVMRSLSCSERAVLGSSKAHPVSSAPRDAIQSAVSGVGRARQDEFVDMATVRIARIRALASDADEGWRRASGGL